MHNKKQTVTSVVLLTWCDNLHRHQARAENVNAEVISTGQRCFLIFPVFQENIVIYKIGTANKIFRKFDTIVLIVINNIIRILYSGIYSHQHLDHSQVQVVTPVKVSSEGELISHEVEHAHGHGHARSRRDLHGIEHHLPHSLHYNLTVDGRNLRLDLR